MSIPTTHGLRQAHLFTKACHQEMIKGVEKLLGDPKLRTLATYEFGEKMDEPALLFPFHAIS